MSENLRHCYKVLRLVGKVKNERLRTAILKEIACDENVYRALREIIVNTLKGNVPLTTAQKAKLRRQRKFIEKLSCNKRKSIHKKRELVRQSGGFLQIAAPAVALLLQRLFANQV
jgi:hypothetical protein